MKKIELKITRNFEKDLKKFPKIDHKKIFEKIDKFLYLKKHKLSFYQPLKIKLKDNLDSTLYVIRVTPKIRLLFTIDDDPLFDKTLITFMRVVQRADLNNAFKSLAESLYQDWLNF